MKRNIIHYGALQQRSGITQITKTLILLLLTSIVLIASCKKDKKPITPEVYVNQGEVTTFAGTGNINPLANNGKGDVATFNNPMGLAVDKDGNVYVADTNNNRIRKITKEGIVSTLAGTGDAGFLDGKGTAAKFNIPTGIAVDAKGNVYVADTKNYRIRKITPEADGSVMVSTLAGTGNVGFVDNVVGTQAQFNDPTGIVVDTQGNVYVADSNNSHRIRKIVPKQGGSVHVSTLAGTGDIGFVDNVVGTQAKFSFPQGIAVDAQGNLYVCDGNNNRIRKITPQANGSVIVSTLAGTSAGGFLDGKGKDAKFNAPHGISIDAQGNVYVADGENHRIRKISPDGVVKTLAGSGYLPNSGDIATGDFLDGKGTAARFNNPYGVAVAADGRVYVADSKNNRIRKIE